MTTQALIKKITKIEKDLAGLIQPKDIFGKMQVDEEILKKAKKAIFDFDIEKFVSKKDVKSWK